jgi:hypothetical protein
VPPGRLERACCIIVGVIAGGAGGYVAFERSNQLGSAVLLVIGAVFLIIGIQGTRLMRFASGSSIVELEQKKRNVVEAFEKAQDEGKLEKASGIIEGADIASPALGLSRDLGVQYELQVSGALVSMGYLVQHHFPQQDYGSDLTILNGSGGVINAVLQRHSVPLSLHSVQPTILRATISVVPVILITYSELTMSAQELVIARGGLEVVQWRDENDNDRLADTLRRMFASLPSGPRIPADDQL